MTTATMDFFRHQDEARRRSSLLVACYIIAVTLIILSVYFVIAILFALGNAEGAEIRPGDFGGFSLFLGVTATILLIVGGGTAFRIVSLSGDGGKVATMLGGREVQQDTTDLNERKLINVVQEMAIASGTAAPRVFVIADEKGINAFAAGYRLQDAVIAVTQGTIEQLNRDELQGVIAHEFSHIFNGDMRLNVRLMGVLFGILMISIVGRMALRTAFYAPRGGSRRNNRDGRATAMLAIAGILLVIIGYIGVLFAKIIKAAVSRQREYLADASAVQFTRNPMGIGGALKKIAGYPLGAFVASPNAEEASHFFFANGLRKKAGGLLATHPPLSERIRRIEPAFAAQQRQATVQSSGTTQANASGFAGGAADITAATGLSEKSAAEFAPQAMSGTEFSGMIGQPGSEHMTYAIELVQSLPDAVRAAPQTTQGARALAYGLLLDTQPGDVQTAQKNYIKEHETEEVASALNKLEPELKRVKKHAKLPLIDLCLVSLRQMTQEQYRVFRQTIAFLVDADGQLSLSEYTLRLVLFRHLDRHYSPAANRPSRKTANTLFLPACRDILSVLADWGCESDDEAQRAFRMGAEHLDGGTSLQMIDRSACTLSLLDDALAKLDGASPQLSKAIIQAVASCIASNGTVNIEEGEALRAIAETLDCPVPPLLPGQPLKQG